MRVVRNDLDQRGDAVVAGARLLALPCAWLPQRAHDVLYALAYVWRERVFALLGRLPDPVRGSLPNLASPHA